MGMRPTLAVCYEGKIIDAYMLKNWGIGSLLIEAFRIYDSYKDCKTAQEYKVELSKKNPEYESFDDEDEYVDFIMSCSEFSLMIDMSLHCIYCGYVEMTKDELLKRPDSRTMMATLTMKQQDEFHVSYLYNFIECSVIWLEKMDVERILSLADDIKDFDMYDW